VTDAGYDFIFVINSQSLHGFMELLRNWLQSVLVPDRDSNSDAAADFLGILAD
jgi:hypothetical protein